MELKYNKLLFIKKLEERKRTMAVNSNVSRDRQMLTRVVGMYRLYTDERLVGKEALGSVNMELDRYATRRTRDWKLFQKLIWNETETRVINQMADIVDNQQQEMPDTAWTLYYPPGTLDKMYPRQPIAIKHGNAMEAAVRRFIEFRSEPVEHEIRGALSRQFDKGVQLDSVGRYNGGVHYRELKYSLKHDTEKVEAVIEKVDKIQISLLDRYENEDNVSSRIVSLYWPTVDSMKYLKPGYAAVRHTHLMGYIELFASLGVHVTEEMWRELHRDLGRACFDAYLDVIG